MDPTFGYPSLARFSWTTIKVKLEKDAHAVKWLVPSYFASLRAFSALSQRKYAISRIDEGQASLVSAFESAIGRDKDRCAVTKDLCIKSVGTL